MNKRKLNPKRPTAAIKKAVDSGIKTVSEYKLYEKIQKHLDFSRGVCHG